MFVTRACSRLLEKTCWHLVITQAIISLSFWVQMVCFGLAVVEEHPLASPGSAAAGRTTTRTGAGGQAAASKHPR